MADADHDPSPRSYPVSPPRWLVWILILGLYLTLRGYHSRDNDQAYRLPLLLHRQDPALFADDPFVRAFDAFNPHHGYLVLLDLASRPLGLSAGLFGLFALTFAATCLGIDRLARTVWPEPDVGSRAGWVAAGLVLAAKAGNVGTIHLFEAMLLDRLVAFAFGWLALAWAVGRPDRCVGRAAVAIGLAAAVHPTVGLQLAMLLGASWVAWSLATRATGVDVRRAALGLAAIGLALVPWALLYLAQSGRLYSGLPSEEFRLLSVELQGPQHMLPHLWRRPQWLAFGCYPILALLALGRPRAFKPWPAARTRLTLMLAVSLAGLVLAWLAIEVLGDLRVTLFQPFRMATTFRGLALVAASGRIVRLWSEGGRLGRARAALLVVGLAGDWTLVVATAVDVASAGVTMARDRGLFRAVPTVSWGVFGLALALGLAFLARHDTESGHWPLLAALLASVVVPRLVRGRPQGWDRRRLAWAFAGVWAIPLAALLTANLADTRGSWAVTLVERCRFAAVPTDDIERLAVWCRGHTPADARFIGPPGPKTFRLWSLRTLAFNRASSPYHAEGLADWASRFRDHVGIDGPNATLVRAYRADRHGLERRYQEIGDAGRASLAIRQGAEYIIAAAPEDRRTTSGGGPLELLHVEGRYAVFRVRRPGAGVVGTPARPPGRTQPQARTVAAASAGTG